MNNNTDRCFNIDGKLVKNPSRKTLEKVKEYKRVEYVKGIEGVITEQWWVDIENKTVIDFSYSTDTPKDLIGVARKNHFEKYHVNPAFDKKYILPPSYFMENGIRLPH